MKKLLPLIIILLSGCTILPKYNYQSQISADPEIILGDRLGGGSVTSPARTFKINIKDADANKCTDFAIVGTTSNHWMGVAPKSIKIRVPAGKAVLISGTYFLSTGFSNTSCTPLTLMFLPKDALSYSIDIDTTDNKCNLSIVRKTADEQGEKVDGITALPSCKE